MIVFVAIRKPYHVNGKKRYVLGYRKAMLLKEGDRYSLWDPAAENELARGMTQTFVDRLFSKKWLTNA